MVFVELPLTVSGLAKVADFEAQTCQAVNLSKCTKVKITRSPRLTYIACYALAKYKTDNCHKGPKIEAHKY